jgi:hypothetical protein
LGDLETRDRSAAARPAAQRGHAPPAGETGCNVREVSEWAGHNNVAFTLTRYGGLFEDGADEAVDRLDALLGGADPASADVVELRRTDRS